MNLNTISILTIVIVCISIILVDGNMGKRQIQRKNHGSNCPPGECLSKYGHCGASAEHCGKGCRAGACYYDPSDNLAGDDICAPGECLSQYGYCGRTEKHCGEGCKGGPCGSVVSSSEDDTGKHRRYKRGPTCGHNECLSKSGHCGIGDKYCGDGCENGPCFE